MVDVAIACYGGADAASNIIDHLHIKLTVIHPHAHPITRGDGVRGLHRHTIDLHVPGLARLGGLRAGFYQANGPNPGVYTRHGYFPSFR